nr:hypothetical protein [Nitrosomonas nitrosa]
MKRGLSAPLVAGRMDGWNFVNPDGSDPLRKRKADIVSYAGIDPNIPEAEIRHDRQFAARERTFKIDRRESVLKIETAEDLRFRSGQGEYCGAPRKRFRLVRQRQSAKRTTIIPDQHFIQKWL